MISSQFFLVFSWEVYLELYLDLNVSLGFALDNIEGPGETKLNVSLGTKTV